MQRVKVQLEWHLCPKSMSLYQKVMGNVVSRYFSISTVKNKVNAIEGMEQLPETFKIGSFAACQN